MTYHKKYSVFLPALFIILAALVGCSMHKNFNLGREAVVKKDWDNAVAHFLKALGNKPDNVEYRISLTHALISASNEHLRKGKEFQQQEKFKAALVEYDKALEYNPENNSAQVSKKRLLKKIKTLQKDLVEKTDLQKLKEKKSQEDTPAPRINYKKIPYILKFTRTDLKEIFKAFGKASGINFIFDQSFKSVRMALDLEGVDFMGALDNILMQSKLFYKVLDPVTVMIIPDTPAKRKQFEELVLKTIFLSNSNPEELSKIIRTMVGIKALAVDKALNAITLKATPAEMKLTEKLVELHDKPQGELFIDIEIIEVNRNRAREYGIELSQYSVTETYLPQSAADSAATGSTIRANMLPHTDASDYLLTLPSVHYKLLRSDRLSRIKARPQLRVLDQQEVKVSLGDKVPIPTTSFVPYNTAGPAQQPITSYQMQEVGIKIDITPRIHHDGLITLKMKFELTFITSPGSDRLPPTIGNRSVETVIKLKDSETSILAGLLRDTERKSLRGLPFIARLPILKEIFSGNTNEVDQTDIILTLTPRIVRYPEIAEEDMEYIWAGTLDSPGLRQQPPQLEEADAEEAAGETKTEGAAKTATSTKEKASPAKTKQTKPTKNENPVLKPVDDKTFQIAFIEPGPLKKDTPATLILTAQGGSGGIRSANVELQFDPASISIIDVVKGKLLSGTGINSHLLKNIDSRRGRIRVNISMEQPLTVSRGGELAVIRFKPLKAGEFPLTHSRVRIFDANMKEMKSNHSGVTLKITE